MSCNSLTNTVGSCWQIWHGTQHIHVQWLYIQLLHGATSFHSSEFWSQVKKWRKQMPTEVALIQSHSMLFWNLSLDQFPSSWTMPLKIQVARKIDARATWRDEWCKSNLKRWILVGVQPKFPDGHDGCQLNFLLWISGLVWWVLFLT
jgi:hypothetical protein